MQALDDAAQTAEQNYVRIQPLISGKYPQPIAVCALGHRLDRVCVEGEQILAKFEQALSRADSGRCDQHGDNQMFHCLTSPRWNHYSGIPRRSHTNNLSAYDAKT